MTELLGATYEMGIFFLNMLYNTRLSEGWLYRSGEKHG